MIKTILVDWVHWTKSTINFWKRTSICGESKLWKTTILNSIMACYSSYYPWYAKTLPEWNVQLVTDNWEAIIANKKVTSAITLEEDKIDLIRYIVPWNFFRLTTGTPEQRKIITKLLWLDISLLESYTNNIKDLKDKIKQFDKDKEQITLDIIRYEEDIESIWEIIEPSVPENVWDNSQEILDAYNKYVWDINIENRKIQAEYNLLLEDYRRDLTTAESYLSSEIIQTRKDISNLEQELQLIQNKAQLLKANQAYNCKECWTLITPKDNTEEVDRLRLEYSEKNTQLTNLQNELTKMAEEKNTVISKVIRPIEASYKQLPNLTTLEDKSKLVWIEYKPWNIEAIEQYNNEYRLFISNKARKESLEKELDYKTNQLKSLDPTKLDLELKRVEKLKSDFNKNVEDKVKQTWLDIRLFETLKNWNIKETFDIFDEEWYNYYATSTGNQLYIEILLAKLFVNYLWLDFILVDRWESIGNNLKDKIYSIVWDLQLIVTEVTPDKEITIKNF